MRVSVFCAVRRIMSAAAFAQLSGLSHRVLISFR